MSAPYMGGMPGFDMPQEMMFPTMGMPGMMPWDPNMMMPGTFGGDPSQMMGMMGGAPMMGGMPSQYM